MKSKFILLLITLLLLCSCSSQKQINKVSCNQMKDILDKDNSILIDVRTEEEYNEKHLDNAINIPLDKIESSIKNNKDINKETNIIVYCKSGIRSSKAASILSNLNYQNIYDLGSISKCS